MVFKTADWQPGYTGFPHDPLSLTVAGAVVLKNKKIELGAIVRGPFTTYPGTTDIVFAINRGAGPPLDLRSQSSPESRPTPWLP